MSTFNRCIARLLIVCTLGMGMPVSSMAGIVATDRVHAGVERDQVVNFLERADVRARMQGLGVDPDAARARVDAMSDDEVAALASRIDEMPAGGHDVLSALVLIFIILLITDILGLTKIFPFTRPVR
ncbi:MAG TPA: PA2779 family protein [Burkholderiales bacterium]|nr:PA2779 family protein [Burkholderiales bacterium]